MSGCLPMRLLLLGLLALSFFDAAATEIVRGTACYRFSDNESLNAAREIALSMAKRDALESNSVFVESTSNLENMTTTSDVTAGNYVVVTLGMDAQTLSATALQYMLIDLSIIAS